MGAVFLYLAAVILMTAAGLMCIPGRKPAGDGLVVLCVLNALLFMGLAELTRLF